MPSGYRLGSGLARQPFQLNQAALLAGLGDVLQGRQLLSAAQIEDVQQQIVALRNLSLNNDRRGREFRARYTTEPQTTLLDSGVLYSRLTPAGGAPPRQGAPVAVRFRLTTAAGRVVADTLSGDMELELAQDEVIPGLREVVWSMPQGARWEIVVPPEQAYGERGSPPQIGPNETLIFELLLLHEVG